MSAALSFAAFLSDTMTEGDTCLPPLCLDLDLPLRYVDLDRERYELLLLGEELLVELNEIKLVEIQTHNLFDKDYLLE